MNDNRRKLYDALSADYDMGSFEQFAQDIQDEGKRQKLYDAIKEDYDLPDFEGFSTQLGVTKPTAGDFTMQESELAGEEPKPEPKPQPKPQAKPQQKQAEKQTSTYKSPLPSIEETMEKQKENAFAPVWKKEKEEAQIPKKFGALDDHREEADKMIESMNRGVKSTGEKIESQAKYRKAVTPKTFDNRAQKVEIGNTESAFQRSNPRVIESESHYNPVTQKFEKTYQNELGEGYPNRAMAEAYQNPADAARQAQAHEESLTMDERIAETKQDIAGIEDKLKELGWGTLEGVYNEAPMSKEDYDKQSQKSKSINQLLAAKRDAEDRLHILEESKNAGKSGFWRNLWYTATNPLTWTFGLTDLADMATKHAVHNDVENKSPLTDEEQTLLQQLVTTNEARQMFGDDMGAMARWGAIAGEALPFIAEFMLTGGFSGLSGAVSKGAAKGLAKTGLPSWLVKATGTTLGDLTSAAAMANTTGAAKTAADAIARHDGDAVVQDENGEYHFGHYEKGEDGYAHFVDGGKTWAKSIYEAEAANTIEYYTEMLGEHMGIMEWIAKRGATKKLSAYMLRKLGLGEVSKDLSQITLNAYGRAADNVLKRAKINSIPEEILEEEANIGLNAMFVGDNSFSDYLDGRTQADIVGGMFFSVGFMQAMPAAYGTYKAAGYLRAKHNLDNSSSVAAYRLTDDVWKELREKIDATTNENIADRFVEVMNDNSLTQEQKVAVMDYLRDLTKFRGYNMGMAAQAKDIAESTYSTDGEFEGTYDYGTNTSYEGGYNAEGDQRNDIKNGYEYMRQQVAETFSEEDAALLEQYPLNRLRAIASGAYSDYEKKLALDFVNAKATYDGMMQRVDDDVNSQVTISNAMIDSRTHKDGMIHPVTIKGGRNVYVVDGRLAQLADGSVDAANSDDMLIVKDESGQVSFISPKDIMSVDESIDAEEEKQTATAAINEQVNEQSQAEIDGTLPFNAGDQYDVVDNEGNQHRVTIGISVGLPEGQVMASIDGAEAQPMNAADIQEMADNANLARLAQNEEEKAVRREQEKQEETGGMTEGAPAEFTEGQEIVVRNEDGEQVPASIMGRVRFENGEFVPDENGNIIEYLADGEVMHDNIADLAGKTIGYYEQEQAAEEEEVADTQEEAEETEEGTGGEASPEQAGAYEPSVPESEEEEVSVDENGMPMIGEEPDFMAVTPERGHQYIYNEADFSTEEADEFVALNKKVADKALATIQNKKPKIKTSIAQYNKEKQAWQAEVASAQQKADYWAQVQEVQKQALAAAKAQEFAEKTEDAGGMANVLADQKNKQARIDAAKQMYGDYFDADMSTPQDIYEMIAMHLPKGLSWEGREGVRGVKQELGGMKRAFGKKGDTQFYNSYLAKKGEGIGFDEAVHTIWESADNQLPNGEQLYDSEDIRGALIEMFMSADKPFFFENYVLNSRIASAETMRAAEDEARMNAEAIAQENEEIMRLTGLTPEEYEAWIMGVEVQVAAQAGYENSEEFFNTIDNERQAERVASQSGEEGASGVQEQASDETGTSADDTAGTGEDAGKLIGFTTGVTSSIEEIEEEESKVNTNPTEAQKEAGNYKKGHIKLHGLDITIENPKGSVRSGVDANGNEWSQVMNNSYGYIRGTEGVDGERIDVFLSDDPEYGYIYVIDQVNPETGEFDTHKIMYGFDSVKDAMDSYLSNYEEGWNGLGAITGVTKEEFKKWVESSHRKTKPFADYKSVKATQGAVPKSKKKEGENAEADASETVAGGETGIEKQAQEFVDAYKKWGEDVRNDASYKAYNDAQNRLHEQMRAMSDDELSAFNEKYGKQYGAIADEVRKEQGRRLNEARINKSFEDGLNAQGEITGTAKAPKVATDSFTSKDETGQVLNGVYHDESGYAVATDGRLLVADKSQYDEGNKGKIVASHKVGDYKKGDVIPGNYPKWRMIVDGMEGSNTASVAWDGLRNFLAGAEEQLKARWKAEKESNGTKQSFASWSEPAIVAVRMPNGEICVYNYGMLRSFADAAASMGMSEITYGAEKPLKATNDKGVVMLMPVNPTAIAEEEFWHENEGRRLYYEWGGAEKAQTSKPAADAAGTVAKPAEEAASTTAEGTAAEGTAAGKPAATRTRASKVGKIDDFGEKIGGARKDVARGRISDTKKMTVKDLTTLKKGADDILSQANIMRLYKDGQMDEQTARGFMALNNAAKVAMKHASPTGREIIMTKYRDAAVAWEEGKPFVFEVTDEDVKAYQSQFGVQVTDEKARESLDYLITDPYNMFMQTYEAIDYPAVERKLGQYVIVDYTSMKGRHCTPSRPYWVKNGLRAQRGYPFGTMESAVAELKKLCPEVTEKEKKARGEKAEHGLHVTKEGYGFYIKSRNIPGNIYLSPKFWTEKEAKKYLDDNLERLKEREQRLVDALMGSNIGMAEREGVDYRNGKDVTPQDFLDEFGFRGVEFGNWVPQGERQMYLNKTYDAIKDFCAIVGISPRAFSLGGRLGLAFGARGKSRAMAHYEPGKEVINLTRMSGVGSLAHEWFHALDNYLAKQKTGNMSDMATETHDVVREELGDVFKEMFKAMRALDYDKRSRRAGEYWGRTVEEFARLFENYIYNKLAAKETTSPVLVRQDVLLDNIGDDLKNSWPYPSAEENAKMEPLFDKLFDTIQEKTDANGNVVLFQKVDGSTIAREADAAEEALRDEVIRLMREAGIEVSTDWEEGQRVLDDYRELARLMGGSKKKSTSADPVPSETSPFKAGFTAEVDAAKVAKNLETLIEKAKNYTQEQKNGFIEDLAKVLGTRRYGSKSEYATFETKNGLVTIRLADHNAKTSNFDHEGRSNGVSIVISRKPNNGIENDGEAHLVEFFYPDKALKKAEGTPYADIVRSIQQMIYSGEYNDATGLATRQEVNADALREMRAYHGSGADFDAFDHSFIGTGEGAQAYGWGTYVTEVEGIGRTYARSMARKPIGSRPVLYKGEDYQKANQDGWSDAKKEVFNDITDQMRSQGRDSSTAVDNVRGTINLDIQFNEKGVERSNISEKKWNDAIAFLNGMTDEQFKQFVNSGEWIGLGEDLRGLKYAINDNRDLGRGGILLVCEQGVEDAKRNKELYANRKAYNEKKLEALKDFDESDFTRVAYEPTLYTVDIPEDNGSNYLDYDASMEQQADLLDAIGKGLEKLGWKRNGMTWSNETHRVGYELAPYKKGRRIYEALSNMLGSDKAASEFLHDVGIVGMKYPTEFRSGGRSDGSKNYVIFDENDAKITDNIKFFRTSNGEAYGFTLNGKIYLDPRIATSETPIHEYAHLWAQALRQANPEAWEQLKQEMLGQQDVLEYVKKLYPELEGDALVEEVFTHYSGKRGAERLRQEMQAEMAKAQGILDKASVANMFRKLGELLKKFWEMSRDLFAGKVAGIENISGADFADMMMADLMNKVDPRKAAEAAIEARDKEYAEAVAAGDKEKVDAMLREEAARKGYTPDSDYQGTSAFNGAAPASNAYFPTREERIEAYNNGDFDGSDPNIYFRDGEGVEDIFDGTRMGLNERITAASARLSNNHKEDKRLKDNAMRAIGGNLTDLRKAMSLQKKYDKTTIKRVADLARILMDNGYLGNLGATTVKRIMATIRDSIGHKSIEEDVQKIMDIMVDSQLKQAEETLRGMENVKGSKINAKGIEVQGELDPSGVHIMKVFKRARMWDETEIEAAMSDAQTRIGSSSKPVADDAELDYTALELALDYAQNIKASKQEEHGLREMLRKVRIGAIDETLDKEAKQELIESLQQSLRQNKIDRAQAYLDLVAKLSSNLIESNARAQEFRDAEKQRIREIQHNANSDMEGIPSDEHKGKDSVFKMLNNFFGDTIFAPLATYIEMLRLFGKKSANGEGYLFNRFGRGWVNARQKEINGVREKFAILDKKAAELFGGKIKSWGDLIIRTSKLPKATVSFWNGGRMQEYDLPQGNMLYIYMVNKMIDGKMKLRKMGITEDDVTRIKEALDPRLIELADWVQSEFLVSTRNEYNETHKRLFGASMAAIEDYMTLNVLKNALADKPEDLDNPNKGDGISTATGSIIKRTRNAKPLDILNSDALGVVLDHIAKMEHWNAFAEYNRDLNILRTYKHFRNQVENMTTIYGNGKNLWEKFNEVCQMAVGSYRPIERSFDKGALKFAQGVSSAKVAFRLYTATKQLASIVAYFPYVRADYLAANIIDPKGAWGWSIKNLPIFEERWRSRISGDPRLASSAMDWRNWRANAAQYAARYGMTPNAFLDALTVSIGAHAAYQTRYAQYKKDGYNDEDANRRAIQDAEMAYNETQQSSEGAFTSTMQVDRTWLSVLFSVFRNASMSYQRQLHGAIRDFKNHITPNGYKEAVNFMKKQFVRDGLDEEKAAKNAKRRINRQIRKNAQAIVTFGYICQMAWNLMGYAPYLLFGGDDDEKDKMMDNVWAKSMFGSLEGFAGGDIYSEMGRMFVTGDGNPAYIDKSMPLTSDLYNTAKEFYGGKHQEALTDMIDLIVQSGIGFNPQTITDAALAITDACEGDPELAREATICIARILQVPKSQTDKMYFDEVGLNGSEIKNYSIEELAERYARYNVRRGRFFTPWEWNDEQLLEKKKKTFGTKVRERLKTKDDETLIEASTKGDKMLRKAADNEMEKRVKEMPDSTLGRVFDETYGSGVQRLAGNEIAKRMGVKDGYGKEDTDYGVLYKKYRQYVPDLVEDCLLLSEYNKAKADGDADRAYDIKKWRDEIREWAKDLTGILEEDDVTMKNLRDERAKALEELGLTNNGNR